MNRLLEVSVGSRKQSRLSSAVSSLPVELILIIASFLVLEDISHLLQASRFLAQVLEPYLYARLGTHSIPRPPRSVIYWAAESGLTSVLEKIYTHSEPTQIPGRCSTIALSFAARHGQTTAAKLLLGMGAEVNDIVALEGCHQFTALHRAAKHGHIETATLLLGNGADLNQRGSPDEVDVLLYAARSGQTDTSLLLLSRGADIKTPYLIANAVFSGNVHLVRTLLDEGAEIKDSWYMGLPAIHWTVSMPNEVNLSPFMPFLPSRVRRVSPKPQSHTFLRRNIPMLQLLLERGISPNEMEPGGVYSLLHMAAADGDHLAVALLLRHGARTGGFAYTTPLHMAVERRDSSMSGQAVVELLLEAHASVFTTNYAGKSALDCARQYSSKGIIALLEEAAERASTGTL
ncbi:ankyrin repeat-containing domain protein [Aspergillus heterothallicus]